MHENSRAWFLSKSEKNERITNNMIYQKTSFFLEEIIQNKYREVYSKTIPEIVYSAKVRPFIFARENMPSCTANFKLSFRE